MSKTNNIPLIYHPTSVLVLDDDLNFLNMMQLPDQVPHSL